MLSVAGDQRKRSNEEGAGGINVVEIRYGCV